MHPAQNITPLGVLRNPIIFSSKELHGPNEAKTKECGIPERFLFIRRQITKLIWPLARITEV